MGGDAIIRAILHLKSPNTAQKYLAAIHRTTFIDGDLSKNKKWDSYPPPPVRRDKHNNQQKVMPIRKEDLTNPKFMKKRAIKLSFDISRFTEFLTGYTKVDDDIKPIMLHYSMIYLLDFFSRTWLEYDNSGHGMSFPHNEVVIRDSGIFQRAVDTFYFLGRSNIFSLDEEIGVEYPYSPINPIEKIGKMKYSGEPKIPLYSLIGVYRQLSTMKNKGDERVLPNQILVGYAILFAISSKSRYRAKDWFKPLKDRELKTFNDDLQYDFLYEHIPYFLMDILIKKGKLMDFWSE